MKPTEKLPETDRALTDIFGIDRKGSIEAGVCVFCKAPLTDFRNAISEREAAISGQCQKCQDEVFGYDEPDPPKPERVYYTPTENDYVVGRMPMVSGRGEAEARCYRLYVGKSGKRWLVADQEDAGENVYVEGGPNSDGFGGSTLTFPLVDGTELKLKGPWHSNSQALFDDTGVDVRDKHYTFVVIGRRVEYGRNYETVCADVIYKDPEPQLGSFNRGDELGREYARREGQPVYVIRQSKGGGCYGFVKPDDVFYWESDTKASITSAQQDAIIRG